VCVCECVCVCVCVCVRECVSVCLCVCVCVCVILQRPDRGGLDEHRADDGASSGVESFDNDAAKLAAEVIAGIGSAAGGGAVRGGGGARRHTVSFAPSVLGASGESDAPSQPLLRSDAGMQLSAAMAAAAAAHAPVMQVLSLWSVVERAISSTGGPHTQASQALVDQLRAMRARAERAEAERDAARGTLAAAGAAAMRPPPPPPPAPPRSHRVPAPKRAGHATTTTRPTAPPAAAAASAAGDKDGEHKEDSPGGGSGVCTRKRSRPSAE
jgi:hypothetical protein